jgi:hypothetical protein
VVEASDDDDARSHHCIAIGSATDSDWAPVDSGLSVAPEDLGLQFLREATEYDALDAPADETLGEAKRHGADVDLRSNVIHESSLFDEASAPGVPHAPHLTTDEAPSGSSLPEARRREQARERRELRRLAGPRRR